MAQPAMHGWLQATGGKPGLQQCRLLNASICAASISMSGRRKAFQVVLYNPLAWGRPTEPIRVPVGPGAEDAGWTVTGGAGNAYMIGCRTHVQTPMLLVRVPVRVDAARIGETATCGADKACSCRDGLAVQMEVDLGSHQLLEVRVTQCTQQCTTGCAELFSVVAPAADMLAQSIPRMLVLCTFLARLPE